ncbi:MAG: methyltransferase family protein [Cyclobacteriaceae bacterium]
MSLVKEFEDQGNWLFVNRSYLPLLYYPLAVLFIYLDSLGPNLLEGLYDNVTWIIFCLLVGLSGLFVRAYTIGHTPKGTSGRNTKEGQVAEVLNSKGIYSMVRHPLYLGNYLMWLGLFLYVGNIYFVIIASLIFWLYYERIMFAEEAFLRKKFGPSYDEWANRTAAFLPDFSKYKKADLEFSMKNVLKREYNGLFNLVLSFTLLSLLHHFLKENELTVHPVWLYALGVGLLALIVLRTLKKKTNLLQVEGR